MVYKFNPKTNRFENNDGATPAEKTKQQADQIIARADELVAQGMPQAQADSQARREVMGNSAGDTGATATTTPREGTRPRGRGNRPANTEGRPKGSNAPTTTQAPATTTPRRSGGDGTTMAPPTTTVPPKGGKPATTTAAPTTTVPKSSTTTAPAVTTTTVPKNNVDSDLVTALRDYLDGKQLTSKQISGLNAIGIGSSGGSGGSSGPTAAQKKASAKIQTDAGKKAQAQYNAMAAKFLQDAQAETGKYYAAQQAQANTAIDDATKDYLANLIAPTAYSNVPIARLTPEQQGLQQNLQAYGATGQQAEAQRAENTGFNDFMSKLLSASTQQLQQADTGYFEALKNAGTGGQMAARQGVAGNTAFLQGQSQANIDAVRRQLLQAGIEALMSGQANAANTLAS